MSEDTYGIRPERALATARAPELSYRPRIPKTRLGIGLIGCGGISQSHLRAYRKGGYNIVALCSRDRAKADARRAEFFPEAEIVIDYRELLAREDVAVVDIATHADVRPPLIEAALRSGKHVLSQKPFVLELKTGERLVRMAEAAGLRLAVNQNGRWAPHFAWMREAIEAGLVGEISSADFAVHWDHHWIVGTDFEAMPHLILSDFAIHWFDIATVFFGTRRARGKFMPARRRSKGQRARPPFLAHACVEFDAGQATFAFNADCRYGHEDRTVVIGERGTLRSVGPSLTEQSVRLITAEGCAAPELEGTWFEEGFQGAMAELLCAIEEEREPANSARGNLRSLALCFAALASAERGVPCEVARAS